MAQLKDLRVDFVSLVDRAAVRDPQNKSEPRRFLLYKREGYIEKAAEHAPLPDREKDITRRTAVRPRAKSRGPSGPMSSRAEQLSYLEQVSPSAAAVYKQHPTIGKEEMATSTDSELDVSAGARAGIQRALDVLKPYNDEPRIQALLTKLAAIGDPVGAGGDEDADDADKVSKALEGVRATLSKADDLPPSTRENLHKAEMELQREYLAKFNPAAADRWQDDWGRHHGVPA